MAHGRAVLRLVGTFTILLGLAVAAPGLVAWGFVELAAVPAAELAGNEIVATPSLGVVKIGAGLLSGLLLFLFWRYLDFREVVLQERRYRDARIYSGSDSLSGVRFAIRAVIRSFGL